MKYFILYEEYEEYNHLEGVWNKNWKEYSTLIQAQNDFKRMLASDNEEPLHIVVEVIQ